MKERITVAGDNDNKARNKKLIFKINSPFRSCTSKTNRRFIGYGEDVDIAMPMYDLLEYSDNYSMTLGCLWNYYRDEINDSTIKINYYGNKINSDKKITHKS